MNEQPNPKPCKTMAASSDKASGFNANTILLSLVLGLSAWTLKEVTQHGRELAAVAERVNNALRIADDLSSRLQHLERAVKESHRP